MLRRVLVLRSGICKLHLRITTTNQTEKLDGTQIRYRCSLGEGPGGVRRGGREGMQCASESHASHTNTTSADLQAPLRGRTALQTRVQRREAGFTFRRCTASSSQRSEAKRREGRKRSAGANVSAQLPQLSTHAVIRRANPLDVPCNQADEWRRGTAQDRTAGAQPFRDTNKTSSSACCTAHPACYRCLLYGDTAPQELTLLANAEGDAGRAIGTTPSVSLRRRKREGKERRNNKAKTLTFEHLPK